MSEKGTPSMTDTTPHDDLQVLYLDTVGRHGGSRFHDAHGRTWQSLREPFAGGQCGWCEHRFALHEHVMLTPENEQHVMRAICLAHFTVDPGFGRQPMPAAAWSAGLADEPVWQHYDGAPQLKTWADLQEWEYDIAEQQLRLSRRHAALQSHAEAGQKPRAEIGALFAALRALEQERVAAFRIREYTMQYLMSKFRNDEETQEEVARREGWSNLMPPLQFPPEDWQPVDGVGEDD
jgi:hypothetical protein